MQTIQKNKRMNALENNIKFAGELAISHRHVKNKITGSGIRKLEIGKREESILDEYYIAADKLKPENDIKDYTTEWFVDNYYAVKMQIKRIRSELKNLPRHMPVLTEGSMAGFVRVFALATEYVDITGGVVSEEGLTEFLKAYCEKTTLTLDELWSLEAVFSLVLARNIVTLACRRYETIRQSQRAEHAAERIANIQHLNREQLEEHINTDELQSVARFIMALQSKYDRPDALRWLDSELARMDLSANDVLEFAGKMDSNCTFAIRNSITSLMNVNMLDWEGIFQNISRVDAILTKDPDGTYPKMDTKTKNIYRKRLKKRASRLGIDETECAEDIIYEAKRGITHIGNILMKDYTQRGFGAKFLYFAGVWLVFLLMWSLAMRFFDSSWGNGIPFALASILSVIPLYMLSVTVINCVATRLKRPTEFLRLNYEDGIPESARTVIITPALITDKEQAKALCESMEVNYIANRGKNLSFVLVGDYKDCDCEVMLEDEGIREYTASLIRELNKKYSSEIFFYMQRKRLFNEKHGRWFGWERKRGAVIQFNRFLQRGCQEGFYYASPGIEKIVGAKYVITLDSDTRLPFGSVNALVGTIDHPINRPLLDNELKRVVSGYGILQPRMETTVPSANKTRLAKIMAGNVGGEPYSSEVSEVYQDIFGEGSFAGKGIYDSRVFCTVIDGRFPENAILSHDMIEGGYLNAGYVSDVVLADDTPSSYIAFRKRTHRWMRGDWQLVKYLLPTVSDENGNRIPNTLSGISKYKIFDNLLRTLLEPSLLLLLFTGIFMPSAAIVGAAMFTIYYLLPFALDIFSALYIRLARGEQKRINEDALPNAILNIALIADKAVNNADAAIRTLSRLVSGKRLLEWQTASQAERGKRSGKGYYYSVMRGNLIIGALMTAFSVITGNYITAVLGVLFVSAPYIAEELSRTATEDAYKLNAEDEEMIEETARGAWSYFSELCTEENNFLPPDNYQEEPYKGAAARTSPTNIGMMLLGAVAAEKTELTNKVTAIEMIENAVLTLTKLEKWSGHPYNWYDTKTLKPLKPRFVSSADNGNLACSLVAVREVMLEYAAEFDGGEMPLRIRDTVNRISDLLKGMDFSLLYDVKKELLSVGFDVEANRLTEHAYDMLASEARQASFYAVISGAVNARHWTRLSRVITRHSGNYVLKSWSGSMFEYLMPALLMKTYPDTLWDHAFKGAVREQIRYASRAGHPWGISESGYWLFDENKSYQYKAFGIPLAAARYTKTREYVLAPYATALALPVFPREAAKNLRRLKKLGMTSRYGFYEALDLSDNSKNIVRSHMAHHEGMSLVAAANVLRRDCITELFHKAPEVRAGELLLQEKLPNIISADAMPRATLERAPETNTAALEEHYTGITEHPRCTMLTNGSLSIVISSTGANVCFKQGILLNKWESDPVSEKYGHFIFIKDTQTGEVHSVTPSPCYGRSSFFNVTFKPDSVLFQRRVRGIETSLKISVLPDKNAVLYHLSVKNTTNKVKHIEITDVLEPCLATYEEYNAHPQYSDMFLESRAVPESNMIVIVRTSKSTALPKCFAAVQCVTDKACGAVLITTLTDLVSRNSTLQAPRLELNGKLSRSKLYPCASVGVRSEIPPYESTELDYIVSFAESEAELKNITGSFGSTEVCRRAEEHATENSKITIQYKHIGRKAYRLINGLLSALFYPDTYRHWMSEEEKGFLWQFGISGDLPIIYYEANKTHTSGIKLLIKAYDYITSGGVSADLVIVTGDDGYHRDNYEAVMNIVLTSPCRDMLNRKNGIFILRREASAVDCTKIAGFAAARLFSLDNYSVENMFDVGKYIKKDNISSLQRAVKPEASKAAAVPKLTFFNGYGGFNEAKREYSIILSDGASTPHPWTHVLANKSFGTLVTENGGGYTWFKNSRENKLTAWSNDPVSDIPSEAVYIRDDATGHIMSPARQTKRDGNYSITYGLGYAVFEHEESKLWARETVFVPHDADIKLILLELKNNNDTPKSLSLCYYADIRLSAGVLRVRDDIKISHLRAENGVLLQNVNMPQNGYALISSTEKLDGILQKKTDFFGRTRGIQKPRALNYSKWDCVDESVSADCVAAKVSVKLKPHSKRTVAFMLIGGDKQDSAFEIRQKYSTVEKINASLRATREYYAGLCPIRLTTNNKALDSFYNQFLFYQVYVCRYMAKASFYQCSGAYGFRDQLQDVLCFMYGDREEARCHILRACSQQFVEGDVRHWWHEETGLGIRTKISDDMMFLPYVATEYAEFADDFDIFTEKAPFAKGQEIEEGKETHFGKAYPSENTASVYEHCMRAIKRASRVGSHGLPLIGTGDWNDGFDKIGIEGKGESVWLAFFMHYVIERFKPIAQRFGSDADKRYIDDVLRLLKKGISESAWDGNWYKRAYFDDGTPVGSASSDECKIDAIAQGWAAIADITPENEIKTALENADKFLIDRENKLVKLFTPPFDNTEKNPGYIKAYKKGVRENGGQYTHGAVWLMMAFARRGDAKKAMEILDILNPVNHTLTKDDVKRYKAEPYVLAADVYSAEGNEGMGGWTWYTGSAAWMYKVITEELMGIKIKGDTLSIKPILPPDMLPYRAEYCHKGNTKYVIDVISFDTDKVSVDGKASEKGEIKLLCDGKNHKIIVG